MRRHMTRRNALKAGAAAGIGLFLWGGYRFGREILRDDPLDHGISDSKELRDEIDEYLREVDRDFDDRIEELAREENFFDGEYTQQNAEFRSGITFYDQKYVAVPAEGDAMDEVATNVQNHSDLGIIVNLRDEGQEVVGYDGETAELTMSIVLGENYEEEELLDVENFYNELATDARGRERRLNYLREDTEDHLRNLENYDTGDLNQAGQLSELGELIESEKDRYAARARNFETAKEAIRNIRDNPYQSGQVVGEEAEETDPDFDLGDNEFLNAGDVEHYLDEEYDCSITLSDEHYPSSLSDDNAGYRVGYSSGFARIDFYDIGNLDELDGGGHSLDDFDNVAWTEVTCE